MTHYAKWFDELAENEMSMRIDPTTAKVFHDECRRMGCLGRMLKPAPMNGGWASVAVVSDLTKGQVCAVILTAGEDLKKGDFVYQENGVMWRR